MAKTTRRTRKAPAEKDSRKCFVIMPFGLKKDEDKARRIDFNRIYTAIIKPGVESLNDRGINIKCIRSDEVQQAGLIHERMIRYIADADVAVVDLTTANPNVYYELGVRHALRDRVTVLLRRKGKPNPFNIAGLSTIEYDISRKSASKAREDIATYIQNGLASGSKDSLVFTVVPNPGAPREIAQIEVAEFFVPDAKNKRIGMVTGNLRHTNLNAALLRRPIDIWLNSENINMQMARPYEASVSGMIRYLGARKDATGTIVEDVIALELDKLMAGRQVVNPGQILATSSGDLLRTHSVKQIFHAATVYGVVGSGWRAVENVEQCITNALAYVDFGEDKNLTSILFPLLGTGTARGDLIPNTRKQVQAAVSYLRSRAEFTQLERVYFLGRTEVERTALRVVFAELQINEPWIEEAPVPQAKTTATAVKAPRTRRSKAVRTRRPPRRG